ncbi:ATP-binding protein [Sulfidibacter corallicola]|uniref:Biotin/lipoyl-binding protein n=1 Tax=Sulfidibacter corallicola TaxID=2818388 RepID=A0A8A4U182_SULCO|nr:biotin carboxylase N-terminal domain-containing protein [Sulfidibacter corallicola]QTD52505.1 biotin/lipoyl-binding protein [Sulfidibacter corallicola]
MTKLFLNDDDRIAIINRGEAAIRFLNAVEDFNRERGTSLSTAALYTSPDKHARFVQRADVAYHLGDALEPDFGQYDDRGMPLKRSPYLQYKRLEEALRATEARAVWVGWGFVAEHAAFADLCAEWGVVFIGPTGEAMRKLGDKIGSKHLAESAGVSVSPWSKGPVPDVAAARRHAEAIGYPLVIKATAGGGGRGIRRVTQESELEEAFHTATSEAAKAFGDGTVFMEKMVVNARHLEVQIVADTHDNIWAAGVRDCSVQRRNQKVIEEGPAVILSPARAEDLKDAARNIARVSGYHNAGTAEFLFDEQDEHLYFMEMNTRLQVEHPVTELNTGLDLVKLQLHVAMGLTLDGEPPPTRGHAIEVRLNAEDPYNQFAPSPGRIELFNPPGGAGVRVDSGVETYSDIPASFDSMVAKILTTGNTRAEAIARMRRALADTTIVIHNGTTNKSFLLELLQHPDFLQNRIHTGWLDALNAAGGIRSGANREAALIAAGIEIYSRTLHQQRQEFFQTVSRGRPQRLPVASTAEVEMKLDGQSYKFEIRLVEPKYYQIVHEDRHFDVKMVWDSPQKARLYYNQTKYDCVVVPKQEDFLVEIDGATHFVAQDSGGLVKSNSPALVLKLNVEVGQEIFAGDALLSLEAMKMEMVMQSPASGVVKEIFVKANDQVSAGDPLISIEASTNGDATADVGERATFAYDSKPEKEKDDHERVLRGCVGFMKGFDVDGSSFEDMLARLDNTIRTLATTLDGPDMLNTFLEKLYRLYLDIEFLFLKEVAVSETDVSSPEQNFFIYLQLLRTGQEHPAEDFVDRLNLAFRHYGLDVESGVDNLEEIIIRLFYSHNNLELKQRLLRHVHGTFGETGAFTESKRLRRSVDKVFHESRRAFKKLHNIIVDFLYSVFEQASFSSALETSLTQIEKMLSTMEATADESTRRELMRQIVYSPHPLIKLFVNKFADATDLQRATYSEILLQRLHLDMQLKEIRSRIEDGIAITSSSYTVDRIQVLSITVADFFERLDTVLTSMADLVRQQREYQEVVIDLYLHARETQSTDQYAERLNAAIQQFPKYAQMSRIRVMIGDTISIPHCFLFIHDKTGYIERRQYRGITETMGQRFYIERLQGFKTERLPTEEQIYLFHCVAHQNADDQRLIAFTEVREPPPSIKGTPFVYPALHREFLRVLRAMRQRQHQFGSSRSGSFYWNQIIIYIRPLLDVTREDLLAYLRFIITGYEHVHLEKIRIYCLLDQPHGDVANFQIEVNFPADVGIELKYSAPSTPPIQPLSKRDLSHALSRRRGLNYPYEVLDLLTNGYFHKGEFEEFDMERDGDDWRPISVKGRPAGQNPIGVVFGIITNFTPSHPSGMERVIVLGDGNFGLGCLSEPECRSFRAALTLARERRIPLEWFSISSGAKISMDNGTENLDWTARVLRDLIQFTQEGGEINLIVDGINVGAQSYWNAEATMLMHTRGCLIMTPRGTMLLTGKGALDYAGSVSAEDNIGIGGMQRIMGPNGQAQYPAKNLLDACNTLFRYYALTYVSPEDHYPRNYSVTDPEDRDITLESYAFNLTPDFKRIGDIFGDATNPGKKKPFDMRQVMRAVADKDQKPLERWPLMAEADNTIVWDTTLGGFCVSMIGIQSFPIKRRDGVPNDGPDTWTGGTLFPLSSKKLARAINVASGKRPIVLLANLSGFDGSPESLRRLQLEYGAEIGRAVVNFKGLILFCVLSRYHGGAYVVFSNVLNPGLKALALEGTYASVIGGAPAAAIVFPREVRKRTMKDGRIDALQKELEVAAANERDGLRARFQEVFNEVYSEKQAELAAEFEGVHTVQRAKDVGSLDDILQAPKLRPYLIGALREEHQSGYWLNREQ